MPVEVICNTCGKRVLKRPCDIKRAKYHYCSTECHLKQLRNPREVICKQCGKKTIVPASNKTKTFCSMQCKNEWQKINLKGKNNPSFKNKTTEYVCAYCGIKFERRGGYGGNGRFCSIDCKGKWQSKNVTGDKHPSWQGGNIIKECPICKKTFEVIPAIHKSGKGIYCSLKCYSISCGVSVTKECPVCNKIFNVPAWKIKQGAGKYCSLSCLAKSKIGARNPMYGITGDRNHAWKGGISFEPYCHKFNEKFKESIRDKFNRECFLCSKNETDNGKKLSVHHVNYDKNCLCGDAKCEFVPLCQSCHAKTNHNRDCYENHIIEKLNNMN